MKPHLVRKLLRIKGPAFAIGVEREEATEQRGVGLFLRKRHLKVMSGHGFVEVLCRQVYARHFREVAEVNVIDARLRTIERGR